MNHTECFAYRVHRSDLVYRAKLTSRIRLYVMRRYLLTLQSLPFPTGVAVNMYSC